MGLSITIRPTDQPEVDDVVLTAAGGVSIQYHIAVSAEHLTSVFTFHLHRSIHPVFSTFHTPDLLTA